MPTKIDPALLRLYAEMKEQSTCRGFTMVVGAGLEVKIDKKIDNTCADPFQSLVDQFSNSNARFAMFEARGKAVGGAVSNRLVFTCWIGPSCGVKEKMLFSSAKYDAYNTFTGLSGRFEASNDKSRPWVLDGINGADFTEFYGKAVKRDANGKYQYM